MGWEATKKLPTRLACFGLGTEEEGLIEQRLLCVFVLPEELPDAIVLTLSNKSESDFLWFASARRFALAEPRVRRGGGGLRPTAFSSSPTPPLMEGPSCLANPPS